MSQKEEPKRIIQESFASGPIEVWPTRKISTFRVENDKRQKEEQVKQQRAVLYYSRQPAQRRPRRKRQFKPKIVVDQSSWSLETPLTEVEF